MDTITLWPPIHKTPSRGVAAPNLADYDSFRAGFRWEQARAELNGLPGGRGLNIAHEAVDRHAQGQLRDHIAIRWLSQTDRVRDVTYGELSRLTNRFANVLRGLQVEPGDRVYELAGRILELYIAALGTLKHRSGVCPLFSAFGPEPIRARLTICGASVLVTTENLYRRKIAAMRDQLPFLKHVLLVGEDGARTDVPGTHDLATLM